MGRLENVATEIAKMANVRVGYPCVSPDDLLKMYKYNWRAREDGTTIWLQLFDDEGNIIEEIPFGNVCFDVLVWAYGVFEDLISQTK
ncbi:MAG: hypothetical protein DRJ38_04530 [Thermoprotei archaeon]|nr:MAG: hypothetical protein DRJ38_04530 [Thermoprotei archaeon]